MPYVVTWIIEGTVTGRGMPCRDLREARRYKRISDKAWPHNQHGIEYVSPDGKTREVIE